MIGVSCMTSAILAIARVGLSCVAATGFGYACGVTSQDRPMPAGTASRPLTTPGASALMSIVPFRLIESGGVMRPVVTATFNGHPFDMMLYCQATFPGGRVQLCHNRAREFGATGLRATGNYGIDRPGHVSALGSGEAKFTTMMVGRTKDRNVSVSVFEVPQDTMGMIGIIWMRRQRVILDFGTRQMIVAPTPSFTSHFRQRLLASGFRAIPMTIKKEFYNVRVTLNGVTRDVSVATATPTILDTAFAEAACVRSTDENAVGHGPTGTKAQVSQAAAPVVFNIADWTSPAIAPPMIVDTYTYQADTRPAKPTDAFGGSLGESFLSATHAVVDFGAGVLYVPSSRVSHPVPWKR